jgi:hypothetical protein
MGIDPGVRYGEQLGTGDPVSSRGAEHRGGTLAVHSKPAQGSRFAGLTGSSRSVGWCVTWPLVIWATRLRRWPADERTSGTLFSKQPCY